MSAPRTYSRVYHEIVEHPRFERVYANPSCLGTWLQMLLTADAMYPMPPPMPPRTPTVRLLIDCGLVIERPGSRYSMRGLEAERDRRSAPGRNAAAVRWQSERNAGAMLEEKRREEKRNGASAPRTEPVKALSEEERSAALQENLRLMNDPKVQPEIRRAAEATVARLKQGRATA